MFRFQRFTGRVPNAIPSALLALVVVVLCFSGVNAATEGAPGFDSPFLKIGVTQTGMVAVSYSTLAAAGVPVESLNPTTFRLYEQGIEISRLLIDADGSNTFSAGDYLLFYGRAVDTDFTGTNLYWLTYGGDAGLEMATRSAPPQPGQAVALSFVNTLHFESDLLWKSDTPLTGVAEHWYWRLYAPACDVYGNNCAPSVVTLPFTAEGIAPGAHTAHLTPRLRGASDRSHHADLSINSLGVGGADFPLRDEYLGVIPFDQSALIEGSNVLTITAPLDASFTRDTFYVNWFDISYARTYAWPTSGQFAFAIDASTPSQATLLGVADVETALFDITNPLHPIQLLDFDSAPATSSGFDLTLGHATGSPGSFQAASVSQLISPTSVVLDTPSNWHNPVAGADWIAITPSTFLDAAQALAQHRSSFQGLRTAVVGLQDVYDEFNGGLPDQEAIRTFIRYAYENWPGDAPRYVVLFGDGNYDPRNFRGSSSTSYFPPYLAAVDPFEGVTAADNRYAALDPVLPAVNPVPFLHVGRLPANSPAEAQSMVAKLIAYDTAPADPAWNQRATFVADNNDYAGNFTDNSNQVADSSSLLPAEISRNKIYYALTDSVSVRTTQIVDAVNAGTLLLNYNGHASWRSWAAEGLWQTTTLSRLTNTGKYPVVLAMSCLEGYYISPSATLQSLGESIVRLPNAGAVASWSPTGKGVATGHEVIFRGFYEGVFVMGLEDLGSATDYAKQKLSDSPSLFKDLIDTYVLFGDPATRLRVAAPDLALEISAGPTVNWLPGQDVIYRLSYRNNGPILASGVILTHTLPTEISGASWLGSNPTVTLLSGPAGGSFSWQIPDVAAGASGTITVSVTLQSGLPSGTVITSSGRVSTSSWESAATTADNFAQIDGQVASPTGLQINAFSGVHTPERFRVVFETLDETDISAFSILLSSGASPIPTVVSPLVQAVGRASGGTRYSVYVANPESIDPIHLWLRAIRVDGSSTEYGPIAPVDSWENALPLGLSR